MRGASRWLDALAVDSSPAMITPLKPTAGTTRRRSLRLGFIQCFLPDGPAEPARWQLVLDTPHNGPTSPAHHALPPADAASIGAHRGAATPTTSHAAPNGATTTWSLLGPSTVTTLVKRSAPGPRSLI